MIPGWSIQVMTAMVCAFIILIWMFHLRSKYQKQSIDNVQCKYITEQGTSYKKLLPVIKGFVQLHPKNAPKGKRGKSFPVSDIATYQIEYPEGWIPRWLKTTIKEAIYREDTWEPIYNRGNPLLDPEMLYNVINERFTEVGLSHSQSEAELTKRVRERLNPSTMYIILACIGLASVGTLILMLMKFNEIIPMLEKMAQGLGF